MVRDTPAGINVPEQEPERHQQCGDAALGDRETPAAGKPANDPAVACHHETDQCTCRQLHVRQVIGSEAFDELRSRGGFDDGVGGHGEERVGKEKEHGNGFLLPYMAERPKQVPENRTPHFVTGPSEKK